jgi:hypothetical protein
MKHCPTCGSSYTDDTLLYCLQDGATLQSDTKNPLSMLATLRDDSFDEERTAAASHSSAPTVEISGSDDAATNLYQEARPTTPAAGGASSSQAAPQQSHTRVIVASVVATILVLGLGGTGAWLFFRGAGDGRGRRGAQENGNADALADSQNAQAVNQSRTDRPDKGGRWFVILGTFPKDELEHANERLELVRKEGFEARVVSSDDYPNMKSNQWVVVIGPSTRNQAEGLLDKVKPKFKDAYTKSGW